MSTDLLHALSEFFGVIIGGITLWRAIPWSYNYGRLVAENHSLREENKRLTDALAGALQTITAWEKRVDQLEDSLDQLKLELAESIIYINDLVVHLKTGKPADAMPVVPDRLRELVERVAANLR